MKEARGQDAHNWMRVTPVLICGLILMAHGPSIFGGFVWDDGYTVRDNPQIRDITNAPSFFTESWGSGAPEDSHAFKKNRGLYRPLTLLSFAINHLSAGLSPTAFHLTNLLIHLSSALLLFFVIRRFCAPTFASLAAIVWSIHPVHTEAIALLSYRTTLLAGFFFIAALGVQCQTHKPTRRTLLRSLFTACALLSKEDALVLVAILPLHDLWIRKIGLKRSVLRALPLAALGIGYLLVRAAIVTASPFSFFADQSLSEQGFSLLQILWLYARILLIPFPLTPFYDWDTLALSTNPWDLNVLCGAFVLIVLLISSFRWRRNPELAFTSTALILSLAPYSHLLPFTVGAAERFLYVPSIFALILLGLAGSSLSQRRILTPFLERMGIVLITIWIVSSVSWSALRHTQWHSNRSILSTTTRLFPESFNAWKALGDNCREEGDLEEAIRYYGVAAETAPYPIAAYLQAATLLDVGRIAEARMRLDDFLTKHPDLSRIDPAGVKMLGDLVDDLNARLRK